MVVIAVEFMIHEAHIDGFRKLILTQAENSRREPGCARFEVAEDETQRGRFLLWEIYRDHAAFEKHKTMPYLVTFRNATAPMVKSRVLSTLNLLA